MPSAIAWIITLPGDVHVAVGAVEFVHVLPDTPGRIRFPDAPAYFKEAISWDHGKVAVFDAGKFSEGIEKIADTIYFGIVRYRSQASTPHRFGALKMSDIPKRVPVDDEMACDLPDSLQHWRPLIVSCFELDRRPVPVLDLANLFSRAPSESEIRAAAGASGGDAGAPNDPDTSGYTDSLATT